MKFLAAAWEQIYGLLVEDGQIAIGTLTAFLACAEVSAAAGAPPSRTTPIAANRTTARSATTTLFPDPEPTSRS